MSGTPDLDDEEEAYVNWGDMPAAGIDSSEQWQSVKLYPNPVRQVLNISFSAAAAGKQQLMVTDMSGKVLMSRTVQVQEGENTFPIDVRN